MNFKLHYCNESTIFINRSLTKMDTLQTDMVKQVAPLMPIVMHKYVLYFRLLPKVVQLPTLQIFFRSTASNLNGTAYKLEIFIFHPKLILTLVPENKPTAML